MNDSGRVVAYNDGVYPARGGNPWGMQMDGRNGSSSADGRYKFGGKERDAETSYDWFEVRGYDSRIGRFLETDPHSTSYPGLSTYCYAGDNPMAFNDPTGMDSTAAQQQSSSTQQKTTVRRQQQPSTNSIIPSQTQKTTTTIINNPDLKLQYYMTAKAGTGKPEIVIDQKTQKQEATVYSIEPVAVTVGKDNSATVGIGPVAIGLDAKGGPIYDLAIPTSSTTQVGVTVVVNPTDAVAKLTNQVNNIFDATSNAVKSVLNALPKAPPPIVPGPLPIPAIP